MNLNLTLDHVKTYCTVSDDDIIRALQRMTLKEVSSIHRRVASLQMSMAIKEYPDIRLECTFSNKGDAAVAYDMIEQKFDSHSMVRGPKLMIQTGSTNSEELPRDRIPN